MSLLRASCSSRERLSPPIHATYWWCKLLPEQKCSTVFLQTPIVGPSCGPDPSVQSYSSIHPSSSVLAHVIKHIPSHRSTKARGLVYFHDPGLKLLSVKLFCRMLSAWPFGVRIAISSKSTVLPLLQCRSIPQLSFLGQCHFLQGTPWTILKNVFRIMFHCKYVLFRRIHPYRWSFLFFVFRM